MRPLKVAFAIFTRLCTYHHELIIERLVPSSPLPKETLYPLRVDPRPLPFWPQATSGHRPKVWLYRSAYSGRSIQTDPGPCGLPGLASCTRREGFGVRPGPHSFLLLRETPPCGCLTLCLLTAHARPGGRLVPAGCGERRPDEPPVRACAGSPRNCAYPAAPVYLPPLPQATPTPPRPCQRRPLLHGPHSDGSASRGGDVRLRGPGRLTAG